VLDCTPLKQQTMAVGRSGSSMSKNNLDEIEAVAATTIDEITAATTIAVGLRKSNQTTTTIF
jgi:hypothetical protein